MIHPQGISPPAISTRRLCVWQYLNMDCKLYSFTTGRKTDYSAAVLLRDYGIIFLHLLSSLCLSLHCDAQQSSLSASHRLHSYNRRPAGASVAQALFGKILTEPGSFSGSDIIGAVISHTMVRFSTECQFGEWNYCFPSLVASQLFWELSSRNVGRGCDAVLAAFYCCVVRRLFTTEHAVSFSV